MLSTKPKRPPSKSTHARELILDTLEAADDRQMESDQLDALIASETGLAAQTVRNVRADLKNDGLIKAVPEKDEFGSVTRWFVVRTLAERPRGTVTGNPETDSTASNSVTGGAKPQTPPVALETHTTVSGEPLTETPVHDATPVAGSGADDDIPF